MSIDVNVGFVGLFDVLGYQSLLEHLPARDAAEIMVAAVGKRDATVRKAIEDVSRRGPPIPMVDEYFEKLRWLVFSDSILLTCPVVPSELGPVPAALVHAMASSACYRLMLDAGLPIRGSIAYGEYCVEEACFAGQPIVTAYRAAQHVDLAAIVVDDSALEVWKSMDDPKAGLPICNSLSLEHDVPYADGSTVRRTVLCPSILGVKLFGPSLRDVVMNSFLAHRKELPPGALRKAENTEVFLRRVAVQRPQFFTVPTSA
jgi:hypothetical protein